MDNNEIWTRLATDEDAQDTIMAARKNGGDLSQSELEALPGGTTASALRPWGIFAEANLGGGVELNARGQRIADELAEELEYGALRHRSLVKAVLRAARSIEGGRIGVHDLMRRMSAAKYGRPWDREEVLDTVNDLHGKRLIKAFPVNGDCIVEGLLPAGQEALSPASARPTAQQITQNRNMTISNMYGNAATGDHVQQSATINVVRDARGSLQYLLDHVDELPEDVREVVRDSLGAARGELELATPDQGRVASFLSQAKNALASFAGSPVVANFLAVISLVSGVVLGG